MHENHLLLGKNTGNQKLLLWLPVFEESYLMKPLAILKELTPTLFTFRCRVVPNHNTADHQVAVPAAAHQYRTGPGRSVRDTLES
jgi:hypothetical protein